MMEFEPTNDIARPECAVGQIALQRLLDGDVSWDSSEAAAHRSACVACREELTLAGALSQPQSIVVPVELTDRILNSAVSALRRTMVMRWAGVGVALAASMIIAVVAIRQPQPKADPGPVVLAPTPAPFEPPAPKVDPPKPLGDSMSEARDAFVSLTKRTATETRDQSAMLVPMPKVPEPPAGGGGMESLADARTGAARSVEPIRDSAKRALSFFARAADPPQRPKRKK